MKKERGKDKNYVHICSIKKEHVNDYIHELSVNKKKFFGFSAQLFLNLN